MDRSSIFNFDTLTEFPRPTRALLFAALLVGVVRLGIHAYSDELMFAPQDEQRYYAFRNDVRYAGDGRPSPKAMILGTSRFTLLDTGYVARPLGLESDEVLNYAVPGLTFWHVRTLFERNPEMAEQLEWVVLDLLPFQMSEGNIFSHETPYFVGASTLGDAWSTRSGRIMAIKGMDMIWPSWSERRKVPEWIALARSRGLGDAERRDWFLNYQEPFRAVQKRQQAIGMQAMQVYGSDDLSPVQMKALHDLRELLPEQTRVLLIWLPVSEAYRQELDGMGDSGRGYREFKEAVQEVEHPRVHQLWVEDAEELNLTRSEFLDEVHFGESGMAKVGNFLEKELAELSQ